MTNDRLQAIVEADRLEAQRRDLAQRAMRYSSKDVIKQHVLDTTHGEHIAPTRSNHWLARLGRAIRTVL